MKKGDKVIVRKTNWNYEKKGTIISQILLIPGENAVYTVHFYENGRYVDGCNVFPWEYIKIDIEQMREDVLNRLLE